MCRKHGHSLALTVLLVVAAQAWQYDPDFMANANMQLQPPMLPNYGMDPLGVFGSPMQMNAAPPSMMMPDPSIDFDSQLMPPQPLQSNELGVPRFAQQQPEVSTVVVQRRAGGFVARPGEEMVPQTECREGEPGCGPPQVIETATTTTATPIDEDKGKEQREEWERERRERREKDEKRKREKQEEEDKKKKEKEEREEKRRREREEKEEQDKKEKAEREERHRREREEKEERDKERREKRREEDERERKSFEDDDDEKDSGKHRKRKHKDDDDDDGKKEDKKKKGSKCSKCSKCQKKKKDEDSGSGDQKEEGTLEHDGKTIHVVVTTKDDKDDKDKEDGDCDGKKSEGEGDCGCGGDDEESEKQKEDPLTAEKKKEYQKLTQMIKKDEEEFSKEADWLTKALSLIAELKQKTHNVQMHLNDLHKDMSLMEHKRQHAAAELEQAEKKKGEEEGLRKMEKELDLLMSASNAANEKINMLSSRKAQYMAKIGEVRNMLQEIKLRHMAANPSAFQSMAESFRSSPPPPAGEQQEDDKMEVVPQFRF